MSAGTLVVCGLFAVSVGSLVGFLIYSMITFDLEERKERDE